MTEEQTINNLPELPLLAQPFSPDNHSQKTVIGASIRQWVALRLFVK
ncbi:MAG: hypothetical protein PHD65_06590 [Gallionella sp.]|nr:hypothetical protein [Gallionella sp.]